MGHSVPIINDHGQKEGSDYYGTMTVDGNCIVVDMKKAYDDFSLKKLERKIETFDDSIRITDSFDFNQSGSYVCRLITYDAPEIKQGEILVGNSVVKFDGDFWQASVKCEKHTKHMPPEEINVYIIDLKQIKNVNSLELTLKFD